jgi:hypothetical protein
VERPQRSEADVDASEQMWRVLQPGQVRRRDSIAVCQRSKAIGNVWPMRPAPPEAIAHYLTEGRT